MKNEMLMTGSAFAANKKWGALKMAAAIVAVAGMLLMVGCKKNDGVLEDMNAGSGERTLGVTETVHSKVFIQFNDSLLVFAANTGDTLWRISNCGNLILPQVDYQNNIVFTAKADGTLLAYNSNTGSLLWSTKIEAFKTGPLEGLTPLFFDGRIYLSYNSYVYCFDVKSGKCYWSIKVYERSSNPTVANGIIFFTSADGYLHAADAKTGLIKWMFLMPGANVLSYKCNPAYSNGAIIASNGTDFVFRVNAQTGKLLWKHPVKRGTGAYGLIMDPTIDNGKVFVRSRESVFCIDEFTGVRQWEFGCKDAKYASPIATHGMLIVSDLDYIYNIDPNTGDVKAATLQKSLQASRSLTVAPVFGKDAIFIKAFDSSSNYAQHLYVLDAQTLKVLWKKTLGVQNFKTPVVSTLDATYYCGESGAQQ